MKIYKRHSLVLLTVAACIAALPMPLATAQTARQTPENQKEKEEIIELSVFEVREEAESGYAATSGLSVSRVATPVTEIPVAAITISEKLIEDLMALTVGDTLDLVSGVQADAAGSSGNQESSAISVRGYTMANAQRDGVHDALFTQSGGFDYSFVDRIEVAKGPNGILYGNHSPGGVVNIVSKRPLLKPKTKVSFSAGSFGFWRAELDTSGLLGKSRRFGYRLAAAAWDTDGQVDYPGDPTRGFTGINPSLIYRGKGHWQVWAWGAFVRANTNRAIYMTKMFAPYQTPTGFPVLQTPNGKVLMDDRLLDDGGGNNLLKNEFEVDTDSYELGASKSFRFGGVRLDARILGRYRSQFSSGSRVRGIGNDFYVDNTGTLLGNDSRRIGIEKVEGGKLAGIYRETLAYDYRPSNDERFDYNVDFNFTFDLGPSRHQLLLRGGLTTGDSDGTNMTYQLGATTDAGKAALKALGYEIVGNAARIWIYPMDKMVFCVPPEFVVANHTLLNAPAVSVSELDAYSYGIMDRISFFNRRLFFVVGANYTSNKQVTVATVSNVPQPAQVQHDKTWVPGYSGLFKLYQGEKGEAVIFANFNKTYTPVFSLDRRLATLGRRLPNRRATNEEYGVKFNLFKSKLVATISRYESEETNSLVTLTDIRGDITGVVNQPYQAPVGIRTSKGWDMDVNFKPFRGLELLASYGILDAELQDGSTPPGVSEKKLSLLGRYEVRRGILKGFSLTYVYKWWGKSHLTDASTPLWRLPAGDQHDVVFAYQRKNWRVNLKIGNIFDQQSIRPSHLYQAIAIIDERNFKAGFGYVF